MMARQTGMEQVRKKALVGTLIGLAMTVCAMLAGPVQAGLVPVSPQARPEGMGGGFTGLASGVPALYQNPAGMSRFVVYTVEGAYLYLGGNEEEQTLINNNSFHVAIVDSKTQLLAAGVGYTYIPKGSFGEHELRSAASYPLVPHKLLFGVGGTYRFTDELDQNLSVDVGMVGILPASLTVGLLVRNAFEAKDLNRHRQFGFGLGWEGVVNMAGDLFYGPGQDQPLSGAVGFEFLAGNNYPLRLGYKHEGGQHYLAGGLGFSIPEAELGISYRQNLQQEDERTLLVGLRFNL